MKHEQYKLLMTKVMPCGLLLNKTMFNTQYYRHKETNIKMMIILYSIILGET